MPSYPPANGDTAHVSAAVVRDQLEACKKLVGHELVEGALSELPPTTRSHFEAMLPVSWIPADAVQQCYAAIAQAAERPVLELQAELVRIGLKNTLSTLWRTVLRFTSDEALISRTPLLYSRSFSRGRLSADTYAPGKAQLVLTGWAHVPELHLNGLSVGVETVLRLAGRKQPSVTYESTPDGAVLWASWNAE